MMHDFYFSWINGTTFFTQRWSFQGGGDFFTLKPGEIRTEEQQYDDGDSLSFIVSELQVILRLSPHQTWHVTSGAQYVSIAQTGNRVHVTCTFAG